MLPLPLFQGILDGGMMPDPDRFVFVSHVSEDRAAALEIVRELERRDVGCWIAPRDVHPGRPYDDEIAAAIENCQAMLLIFSERCNESEYIRREVTVAGESRKLIIPFRIENVQPKRGLRVRLADLHWIDAFAARDGAVEELMRIFGPAKKAMAVEPAATQPRSALNMTGAPPLDTIAGSSDSAARPGHGPATRDERGPSPSMRVVADGPRIPQDNTAPGKTRKTGLWAALVVVAVCVVAVLGFYFGYSKEPTQPPPTAAIAFSNSGKEYYDKKDYDRAIAEYSEAIRLDPKLTAAYYGRGL